MRKGYGEHRELDETQKGSHQLMSDAKTQQSEIPIVCHIQLGGGTKMKAVYIR